jgi:hypothetical protein
LEYVGITCRVKLSRKFGGSPTYPPNGLVGSIPFRSLNFNLT